MSDQSESRVTVWMSEEVREQMDEYIDWRDESRSQWTREAVMMRMVLEDALGAQGVALPDDDETRQQLVERVVRAGVVAAGDDLPGDDGESDS